VIRAVDGTTTPSTDALRAQGVGAVYRYIALGSSSKHLTKAELDRLKGADIAVGLVAESTADQMRGGRLQGIADAKSVQSALATLGLPKDSKVFYAHDQDGTGSYVSDYLDGVATVVGADAVGLYGGIDACGTGKAHWAAAHKVHLGIWQTLAWSGSKLISGADAYQAGANAWPGSYADYHVTIGGVDMDKDTAFTTWGLIGGEEMPETRESLAKLLGFNSVDDMMAAIQAGRALRLRADGATAEPADKDVKVPFDYLGKLGSGGGSAPQAPFDATITPK
jgi:hypothetical protein